MMNHRQRRDIALKATIPLGTAAVAALIVLALTSSLTTSTSIGLLIALVVLRIAGVPAPGNRRGTTDTPARSGPRTGALSRS